MNLKTRRYVLLLVGAAIAGGVAAAWKRARAHEAETERIFKLGVSEIPIASTRGHVKDGKVVGDESEYSYELEGSVPGLRAGVPTADDILIVVHGLNNTADKALNRFALARESLVRNGYRGVVVGFSWDGATNLDPFGATGYRFAKHNAVANGKKLAQFAVDLQRANPGAKVRLLGYSMGARAIAESLYQLNSDPKFKARGIKLESCHLVGAAIDDEHLQTDERYGRAIENCCQMFFNYFSPQDSKLGKYFTILEADRAVGRHDLEEIEHAPNNYRSRDVSSELKNVDDHGDIDGSGSLGANHSAYLGIRNDEGKWVDDGAMDVVFRDFGPAN
jgi:hypothetical protein